MARRGDTIEQLCRKIADRTFPHFMDGDRRDALEAGLIDLSRAIANQAVEVAIRASGEVLDARVARAKRTRIG